MFWNNLMDFLYWAFAVFMVGGAFWSWCIAIYIFIWYFGKGPRPKV